MGRCLPYVIQRHAESQTKSFHGLWQEGTLMCPLFSGIECSVCMGQAFMCRDATWLKKRRNEIMFKYSVCLYQSAKNRSGFVSSPIKGSVVMRKQSCVAQTYSEWQQTRTSCEIIRDKRVGEKSFLLKAKGQNSFEDIGSCFDFKQKNSVTIPVHCTELPSFYFTS